MVSGGGNFGKALIHEKRALGNGLSVLIKEIDHSKINIRGFAFKSHLYRAKRPESASA